MVPNLFAHNPLSCLTLQLLYIVETVTAKTETWLKFEDRHFIKKSKINTETRKFETENGHLQFCQICWNFFWTFKKCATISKPYLVGFLPFFQPVMCVAFLQIRQTVNTLHYFEIFGFMDYLSKQKSSVSWIKLEQRGCRCHK